MTKNVKKVWESHFVVEGTGALPFDMLRYDSAFPMTERDALAASAKPLRRIAITSRKVGDALPSSGRWQSFGWTVVGYFREAAEAEEFRDRKDRR